MIAYLNGTFVEKEKVAISPDDRGFLFADGVYEVIRSYDGRLFEFDAHLHRLKYGLDQLRIRGANLNEIRDVSTRLISENSLAEGDTTVYVQITRGAAPRTHCFPPPETEPTVYAFARRFQPSADVQQKGVKVILVPDQRWSRCDIKTTGLLPNTLANQRAKESGAFEAIFVRDGAILEGSHTNVFFVKDGSLITAPQSNYILTGVTRNIVLGLADKLSIPIQERSFFEAELHTADEAFLSGTTVEITPVTQINSVMVGTGTCGVLTTKLQSAFFDLIDFERKKRESTNGSMTK